MATTRRRLLTGALAAPLAAPFVRPARAVEGSFTLAAYNGIFEDNYRPAVIEPFMRANPGIKVSVLFRRHLGLDAGAAARAEGGAADRCGGDRRVGGEGGDRRGAVRQIRPAGAGRAFPRAINPAVNGAAVTFDNLVLLYSPQHVQPAPTSWKVLWDAKYKGQIAIPAAPDIVGIGLTIMANKTFGGDDYRKLDKGLAALSEMAPNVLSFNPTPDPYTFIINGTAALGVGWNARGQLYSSKSDGRLAVALPDEGSLFQINIMGLVANSKNTEAAKMFIDYALGAEAQKSFTERMFYAPVNTKAQISAEALARTAASPDRMARMLDVDWLQVAKIRDGVTEQWRRRILTRT